MHTCMHTYMHGCMHAPRLERQFAEEQSRLQAEFDATMKPKWMG